ncbi:MAG: 30S ribosomal protein S4 [Candidatus Verstraetearchaeota archaeon]|nr:30S ribosomal protein S4 [Candidatus Verstraetearchaeota archaeon]
MGDPKKSRRKWQGPRHPWRQENLNAELSLLGKYGLRNKRELWTANTLLKSYRERASTILAEEDPEVRNAEERKLVLKLATLGLLNEDAVLDNILSLSVENILDRRLQHVIVKLGYAATPFQARQLIVHGHVFVNGRRVTSPGYLVKRDEESKITCDIQVTHGEVAAEAA